MSGSSRESAGRKVVLDDNAILEALIRYVQERHGDSRVVDVEWLLEPMDGYELPPIKGISVRCTLEATAEKKGGKK
ncbi:MAG TPA: hypothetical protein VGC87_17530 [Pyrinomonadaceae bacterium]|jgi:hypothetical protein